MRHAWSCVAIACCVLIGSVRPVQSQSTSPGRTYRTAVLDLAVHNKMPDDDITEVISKLYEVLRAGNRYDPVPREQIVQAAGSEEAVCADDQCALNVARAVGAEKAIYGDVTKVEIIYELTLTIVDVASGTAERTHVEQVAGHMGDVAKVGVKCAIDALMEPPKVSDYKKGDWRKMRAHGAGGRLMVVMPSHSDSLATQRIEALPTVGVGIHYDAQFRMKNGMEIHYTPSIEYWTQSGRKGGFLRVQHFAFNVADFRWLFAPPVEKSWVFYLGLGPSFILYTDCDPSRDDPSRVPVDSAFQVHPKFGANVMAGLVRHMPRLGWMMDIGFKAKFWDPSTFNLGISFTRPFKGRGKQEENTSEGTEETPAATSPPDEF